MLFNVPQYIDIEDKIVGPLTAKQLGWLIAMGVILLIMWNMLSKPLFFLLGLPVVLIFVSLAFFRPYGQSLGSFLLFGVMYFFRPKVYFWKRTSQKEAHVVRKGKTAESGPKDKRMTSESLRNLAQLIDSGGTQYDDKLEKILKKAPVKK